MAQDDTALILTNLVHIAMEARRLNVLNVAVVGNKINTIKLKGIRADEL